VVGYRLLGIAKSVDEEMPNQKANIEREVLQGINKQLYSFTPLKQKHNLRLILVLKPQSM
jgi:hypothetical protein